LTNVVATERPDRLPRSGTHALSLIALPLNPAILRALAPKPLPLAQLRQAVGTPAQSTLRLRLQDLVELGLLRRRRQTEFPWASHYELAKPGRELLVVADALDAWLSEGGSGSATTGDQSATRTIKLLIDGWTSTMVRALAAKPLTLTELSRLIFDLNYPALERRLGAMHREGLVAPVACRGPGTPYAVTARLRRAIAPLAAAARWERVHAPDSSAPVGRLDVEAAFLLALPLVELPEQLNGSCRLVVELGRGGNLRLAGIVATVENGRVTSRATDLRAKAGAWAAGSATAWLAAVIAHDRASLELGGDGRLTAELIDGLHRALFVNGN